MASTLNVEIPWVALEDRRDPGWQNNNLSLYAYLHPERDRLLYVGKAYYQTVRQRLHGDRKTALFNFLWDRYFLGS